MLNRPLTAALLALAVWLTSCSRVKPQAALPAPPARDQDHDREKGEPRDDNPFEAAEYFREQRVQGPGLLPIERYQTAIQHAAGMRHYSLRDGRLVEPHTAATFGTWESVGPYNVGGRTRGLVVNPQNTNVMWAGGATGGLWETTNGGATWTPVDDFAPVLAINCLVMAPNDVNTLYACTGEQTQNWRGAGIYKTTDGGNTWTQLPATATPDFYFVNAIAISPTSPSHLYAATNDGLWVSLDSGITWNESLSSPYGGPAATLTGGTTTGCFDTIVEPGQTTDTVFAVCHQGMSLQYSVFLNPDAAGSGTWSVVLSDPGNEMWYVVLAAAPSQPSTIYAIAVNYDQSTTDPYYRALLAVYRSTSGGVAGSWTTQISAKTIQTSDRLSSAILSTDSAYDFADGAGGTFCAEPVGNIDFNGQAGYNLAIAVDPLNPNTVWAAGIGLFRSDNGGVAWGFAGSGSHPDQHGLVFDPHYDGADNQTLYSISDGGVYKTTAALGATAKCPTPSTGIAWTSLDNGYVTTQFYHGVPYPGGAAFFGGTQDNGTLRGTGSPTPWLSIYGGDGGVSRLDPLNVNTIYVEYVHGAFAKSTDGGFTFNGVTTGITESSSDFPFIAQYEFDPNDNQRLYTGGFQMWRTDNGMGNWTAESAPIPQPAGALDNIRSIAVSPFNANVVLFGTYSGKIYSTTQALSSNGNTTWNYVMPRSGDVAHLAFDPNQPNTVYATYTTFNALATDNHVYRSTDGGQTWIGIDGSGADGLPDVPVETLLVDPADSNYLYLGTDTGVFASLDGGNTWVKDSDPFANVIVDNLAIDSAEGVRELYAFSYGRGVWRVPLPSGGTGVPCTYQAPATVTAPAAGGISAIPVTTQTNCGWSVRTTQAATTSLLQPTLQAPASGVGSGSAWLTVPPNASTAERTTTYSVQNQAVNLTQAGASSLTLGDEIATAPAVSPLPFEGAATNASDTQNASDPKHSCTGSADYQTAWASFTAPESGAAQITLEGTGGGGEVVMTAYALTGQSIGGELGCTTLPLITTGPVSEPGFSFPVTAGSSYILEFSTLAPNTKDLLYFGISMAPAAPLFNISPPEAIVPPGGSQLFQPVTANLGNTAVSWQVSPQVGVVTLGGEYFAPGQISASTPATITAQSLGSATLQSTAILTVQAPVPVTLGQTAVTNAASYQTGAVSPGEVVTIFGNAIGPPSLTTAALNAQGRLASNLAGTQVLFGNVPAPMVYTSADQVSCVVPYEVAAAPTTRMTVLYNGQATPPLTLNVASVAPSLFTSNASGTGQAAAVNQDYSLNGPGSGAPVGSILSLYGTGEGQTSPGGINGRVAGVVLPQPLAPVSVTIGNLNALVEYAGGAGGATAGLLQVNVTIPNLAPGTYPVVLTIGGQASAPGVTVTVR